MTSIQPIQLYGGLLGPNALKVALVLSALSLPFQGVPVRYDKVKEPDYEKINPNGRLPSIHDPNTGLVIWETGAIIEYLIERYDAKEPRKLSFEPGSTEAQLARSFLFLQTSGQGPYYGQAFWFKHRHHEKIPGAITRYVNEAQRVTAVLDKWLAGQKEASLPSITDGPWLVGNKMSFADISFIPWQRIATKSFGEDGFEATAFPNASDWLERMMKKEPIKKILDQSDEDMAQAEKDMAKATQQ